MDNKENSAILSCFDFQEHSGWRNNPNKKIGVTWDGWCSNCGFEIKNAIFDTGKGLGITGGGRRLASCTSYRFFGGEGYFSEKPKLLCSVCVPNILGKSND